MMFMRVGLLFVLAAGLPSQSHAQMRDLHGRELDAAPILLKAVSPVLPDSVRADSTWGGIVVISTTIDTLGHVVATRVFESLRADVDRACEQAVRQCIFLPAYLKGHPVTVTVNYPFGFPRKKK